MAKEQKSVSDISQHDLENWMTLLPLQLRKIPLNQILIPGSHNTFSYSLTKGKTSPDCPAIVSCLSTFSWISEPIILKWSVTQHTSITNQLMHGIRYLDIRLAAQCNQFYIVHSLYGANLEDLLREVRDFLDKHPQEVLFLDFQHFYAFDLHNHLHLMRLLEKYFDGLICPPEFPVEEISLSFLSERKYQVLIFYRSPTNGDTTFYPGSLLPNPWPDTTSLPDMVSFIEERIRIRSLRKFFVTQAILTPTFDFILWNLRGSLEKTLAIPCNIEILEWISSLPSKNFEPNIVMVDFVEHGNWSIPKAIISHNYNVKKYFYDHS